MESKHGDNVPQRPTLELKRKAVEYYAENMVPKHLEKLLNQMFLDNPTDLYGYMSEYFGGLSKEPVLSKILFESCFATSGAHSAIGRLFCIVNGVEKLITELPFVVDAAPLKEQVKIKLKSPTSSRGKKEKAPPEPVVQVGVPKPKKFDFDDFFEILKTMGKKLENTQILKQEEFDRNISALFIETLAEVIDDLLQTACDDIVIIEPQSEETSGEKDQEVQPSASSTSCDDKALLKKTHTLTASLYLSLLAAHGACLIKNCTLTEHLLPLFSEKQHERFLPVPAVPVLTCSPFTHGKLNMVKALYILPKPQIDYIKGLLQLVEIVKEVGTVLTAKFGVNGQLCDDAKVFTPPFEKIEQVFETLQAAVLSKEFGLEDISIILDVGASDFFDEDKKRYEISVGSHKSSDDLIAIYSDLVEKYPIIGIVDGLASKDAERWSYMNRQLGSRCHVIGDVAFGNSKDELLRMVSDLDCNGCRCSISCFESHSVTSLKDILVAARDVGSVLMVTTKVGNFSNLTTSDAVHLAVACGATFVDVGSPLLSSNMDIYNALVNIDKMESLTIPRRDVYTFQIFPDDTEDQEAEQANEENN